MTPKRIGLIGFDGITAIDLVGPAEAFTAAEIRNGGTDPQSCYEVLTIGLSKKPFLAESGMVFTPQKTFQTAPLLDTLIIPGGSGLRKSHIGEAVSAFIKAQARRTRRIVSIRTGIYGFARTGLLKGRNVTTHWRFARDVALRFPDLKVHDNAIFLKDGPYYTSAGATAGIDVSLHLIEEDYGPRVALDVARELVLYMKRSGGQEQYSEPLQFQTQSIDRFSELATWMLSHLKEDLSVTTLAAKAFLCPRQFTRRFKEAFGHTPANVVEKLRLDEARRRLSGGEHRIGIVAASVGFRSADAFRRAFERRVGVKPMDYCQRSYSHSDLNASRVGAKRLNE